MIYRNRAPYSWTYKYSGYDNCTNSSNWWPKDRNLNHQPPKDRNLNGLEVLANCALYLNLVLNFEYIPVPVNYYYKLISNFIIVWCYRYTEIEHHHSWTYKYSGYDNCTNSSNWWPKDRNLNQYQPPKDRNLNGLEVFATCALYLL